MQVLGIDIGGSGVKGAPVDITTGQLMGERYRIPTPQPATPEAVVNVILQIVEHFNWQGKPIGCGYPGVVKRGVTHTAANVDDAWIGFNLGGELQHHNKAEVTVLNDADAAGMAEIYFGAGQDHAGMVVMITLGTGIGTAAFLDGKLIPNLELGHIEIKGHDAETRAADSAREREDLSWKKWSKRVDRYLSTLEFLINPDLFIIGGGVSKNWQKFLPLLQKTKTECIPAELRNHAGIVGAAMATVYEHDLV